MANQKTTMKEQSKNDVVKEPEHDPLDNKVVDKELRRWQDAIRDRLIELGAPDWKIDGAGCDSGDPLDFTLAEVGQGVGYFVDQLEQLRSLNQTQAESIVEFQREQKELHEQINKLMNSDFVCSRCGSPKK